MVSKWAFRRKARQILFAFKNDEMHLHDALACLEQARDGLDPGDHYGARGGLPMSHQPEPSRGPVGGSGVSRPDRNEP